MPSKRPFGLVDVLLLLLVLGVAAGARVTYLLAFTDGGATSGPLLVQDASPVLSLPSGTEMHEKTQPTELDALVHNLREYSWFGNLAPLAVFEERTAHTAPGYPWLLGMLARWVPVSDVEPLTRWIQCGFGVLTTGLYFLFARRAFESRLVAILAGLLTALHPFWIINTAAINDGTATAFVFALVLFLGSVAGRSGASVASLLFGLSAAGLALLRAALLPFAFVSVLWLLWRSRKIERGWQCALLTFLGFANGLAPWMIRNYQAFQEPIPVATSTYYHLCIGNNPHATGGAMDEKQLLAALAEARGVKEQVILAEFASLQQPERYRRLARDVFAEIRQRPTETGYRRLSAACFFTFSEAFTREGQIALIQPSGEESPSSWLTESGPVLLLTNLVVMLLLAFVAWRRTYPWRSRTSVASLALLWVPLPYVLGHASLLHGPRMPLDGILLTYAAFVLASLWPATGKALREGPKAETVEKT